MMGLLLLLFVVVVANATEAPGNFDARVGNPGILFKFDKSHCENVEETFPSTGAILGGDDGTSSYYYSLTSKAGTTSCPPASHGVTLDETIGSLTSNEDMSLFFRDREGMGLLTVEFWLRGDDDDDDDEESGATTTTPSASSLFSIGVPESSSLVCTNHDLWLRVRRRNINDIIMQSSTIRSDHTDPEEPVCDFLGGSNNNHSLVAGKLHHLVVVYTSSSVERFIDGVSLGALPLTFSTTAFRNNFKFHIGHPNANIHSWSGTIHLLAMYNKALTAGEVEKNYAAYLPDSVPVVRDVFFMVIEDELTPIQFSVGEDGGTFFDFDDEHRPTHAFGEGFTVEDKDIARSGLCITSLPTKGTLWVDGTELTAENTQFPYPIGTTLESSHKKLEYLTAKDGNNADVDGHYTTFTLCARTSGNSECTGSTKRTVTISVTPVNDPPTASDLVVEVFARNPSTVVVITLDAQDVEDGDAHVGAMITRLPEKTDPDGESAGKLYEVSSNGVCNRSKPVELEKKLSSLQVCFMYGGDGSIRDGVGGVVAEVEFEYRAIDSEGATSKGSEDGVVSVRVKNQLEATAIEQWAFEDGIIPEDPALRPADFIDPSKQPVVEGMNLLQLKGKDNGERDHGDAFKYYISSLPSHGKLFDVTEATKKGVSKAEARNAITVDGVVGDDTEETGFVLSSEEGYVYYQPNGRDYFNTRFMVNGEPEAKELGMAPDTFEFGLLIQDEDGKIKSMTEKPATFSVKVSNVYDPVIVTVKPGKEIHKGVIGEKLEVADWVTVTTVDEVEGNASGATPYVWDHYRLTLECGPGSSHYLNWVQLQSKEDADRDYKTCDTWYWGAADDTNYKSCLEAPLHVLRLAMDPLVFLSHDDAATDTECKVAIVGVDPDDCGGPPESSSSSAVPCLLDPTSYGSITVSFSKEAPEYGEGEGGEGQDLFIELPTYAYIVIYLIAVASVMWLGHLIKKQCCCCCRRGRSKSNQSSKSVKKNKKNCSSKSKNKNSNISDSSEKSAPSILPTYNSTAHQMELGNSASAAATTSSAAERHSSEQESRRKEEMLMWARSSGGSINEGGGRYTIGGEEEGGGGGEEEEEAEVIPTSHHAPCSPPCGISTGQVEILF